MVFLILVIGVFNFFVGFALAVYLQRALAPRLEAAGASLPVLRRAEEEAGALRAMRERVVQERLQFDGLTGLHNRSGLEVLFREWRRDDDAGRRTASLAMVDIDRFAECNHEHGTRAGDRLLAALASLLDELVRSDRGFDIATRLAGPTFVLFFGDADSNAAVGCAERIRQAVEATTFDLGEATVEMTVSCSVAEVDEGDTTDGLFKRLAGTLQTAKKKGGNRTCIDEGSGPTIVEPPVFDVEARVVRVK